MLPSLSALVFTGCFSPYDWPSKDTSLWGEPTTYKVCQFEMWKQTFDTRSATFALRKDGVGHDNDSHPVVPRDQCQGVQLTFRWIEGEINGFISGVG